MMVLVRGFITIYLSMYPLLANLALDKVSQVLTWISFNLELLQRMNAIPDYLSICDACRMPLGKI